MLHALAAMPRMMLNARCEPLTCRGARAVVDIDQPRHALACRYL